MTDEEIKKLIHTNTRLLLLLGYATGFVMDLKKITSDSSGNKEKIEWFLTCVENIVYLDKPLPRMP